jgi:hypothetical protein
LVGRLPYMPVFLFINRKILSWIYTTHGRPFKQRRI